MEKVKKTIGILNKVKWLGLVFGAFMCLYIEPRLGVMWAMGLGTVAGIAFIYVCDFERRAILSEYVAHDLKEALQIKGYENAVVEIRHLRTGMIIRIYVIDVGENAVLCNAIVVQRIESRWYRKNVWVTQLVGVGSKEDIAAAKETLDEELINDLKRMRDEEKRKKK